MRKISNRWITAIVIAAMAVIWVTMSLLFIDVRLLTGNQIAAILFGIAALVSVAVFAILSGKNPPRKVPELTAVTTIYSCIYLAVTLGFNFVYIIGNIASARFSILLIIKNLITAVLYWVLIMFANNHSVTVAEKAEYADRKSVSYFSEKIGELLSITTDNLLHKEILKLKETVDLSSSISYMSAADAEREFDAMLDKIKQQIVSGSDVQIVLQSVAVAAGVWKKRNSRNTI